MKKLKFRIGIASIAFGLVMALEMLNHDVQWAEAVLLGLVSGGIFGVLFYLVFPLIYKGISRKKDDDIET